MYVKLSQSGRSLHRNQKQVQQASSDPSKEEHTGSISTSLCSKRLSQRKKKEHSVKVNLSKGQSTCKYIYIYIYIRTICVCIVYNSFRDDVRFSLQKHFRAAPAKLENYNSYITNFQGLVLFIVTSWVQLNNIILQQI